MPPLCKLHTSHYTLYMTHCKHYKSHYTPHTANWTMHTECCIQHILDWTLQAAHSSLTTRAEENNKFASFALIKFKIDWRNVFWNLPKYLEYMDFCLWQPLIVGRYFRLVCCPSQKVAGKIWYWLDSRVHQVLLSATLLTTMHRTLNTLSRTVHTIYDVQCTLYTVHLNCHLMLSRREA